MSLLLPRLVIPQEQMLQSVSDVGDSIKPLTTAALGEAEKLGHQVTYMSNLFPALAGAAIGAASKTSSSQMQTRLLEQSKTLTESTLQLVYASKDAAGNPKSTAAHAKVDDAAELLTEAVGDLTQLLEKAGGDAGLISAMVDEIVKSQGRLQETVDREPDKTFSDYQSETFQNAKAVAKHAQEVVAKSKSSPEEMSAYSRGLTTAYAQLIDSSRGALATIENAEVAKRLRQTAHSLGDACVNLVYSSADVQMNPEDLAVKRELNEQATSVTEKVSYVVAAIQAGAVGTQACNEAVATIQSIVGDLETTAMFCTAGALNPEGKAGAFPEHRVNILETAKQLVEDTKKLVSSAAGSQEMLAEAAQNAVKTITNEADHVKLGAASLTSEDMEAQLLLLTAVKDVALSLGNLVGATRMASGKSVQDPSMENLKGSAKAMVAKVSAMLKTVKNVEDEAGRGVRSLENTIDSIEANLAEYSSSNPPRMEAGPEDLIRSTKGITLASAKAVAAGNSCKQVDVSACANLGRKAVAELLETCKAAAYRADNDTDRNRAMSAGRDCATAFKNLLELIHQIVLKPSADKKARLPAFSKEVATGVGEVVQAAEVLKGEGWVDTKDPNVIAETELLQAAASIEAAAKKLSELKPRTKAHADESLNFEEQILEAAKNIASATSALVKSATAAQRELVAQGKLSSSPQSEDSQWSEGLVSAAKLVATATSNLCEAANLVVQEQAEEEKLIVAAKAVAASTAQLLISCQVKADARSENNRRLQIAGSAVKKATETLVQAAQQASVSVKETDSFGPRVKGKVMDRFRQELEVQEEIARKQRELERAKEQLTKIRRERAGH
jgi:talin